MKNAKWIVALGGVLLAVAPCEAEAGELYRRKLSAPGSSGWFRVQLDADAQSESDDMWLGDEEGRPVPFLRERELGRGTTALTVRDLLTGRDEAGRVTAEFTVTGAAGETVVAEPEQRPLGHGALGLREVRGEMTLALQVEAAQPWVAEVEIARRLPSGEWSTREERVQLYDFGGEFRRTEFAVPREAAEWRLRLRGIQGELRSVRGVSARLERFMAARAAVRVPMAVTERKTGWTLTLERARRVTGIGLRLKGVVAPVQAEVLALDDDSPRGEERLRHVGSAQVWRMPGLNSSEGAVRFGAPAMSQRFRVRLPAGVELDSAEASVEEESLWFVAEAGHDYYLHFGGERRHAVGSLAALPARVGEPMPPVLSVGPRESDPFGRPVVEGFSVKLRRWLPWIVGALVAGLAWVALRLLRAPARP